MPTNTERLDLFKYDVVADANNTFNITNALNNNWDKLENDITLTNYKSTATYSFGVWVKDGDKLYKSLQDNNKGHATSETDWWKKVNLGGEEKLNITLDNATQDTKDIVIGWGMPDYSRVVSIPLPSLGGSLSYTAESNGYFRLMFSALGAGVTVFVNEQQMGSYTSGGGTTSLATYNNVVFQLSKGDTYKISTAQGVPGGSIQANSSIFIPCKGGYNA